MTIKITKLCYNYGPYHLARIEGLIQNLSHTDWEVFGIELARTEEEYPWKTTAEDFPCEIISIIDDTSLEKAKFKESVIQLISVLNKTCPDIVAISGYSHLLMLSALAWCLWNKKVAILLSESTEHDMLRNRWKEKIKQQLILKFNAAVVGGKPQKRYLTKLGMKNEAIFFGYDVVGNSHFSPEYIRDLPNPLNRPFFLAINRFVTKKNLPFLVSAYSIYHHQLGVDAWDLVLCGDGILRPQLEEQINSFGISKSIHLPGFLQQEQLLPYFAHANCFVHASTQEQWGLVINEAMAAALPVLVSERCGCAEDLIIEGVNGFVFDPFDLDSLAQLMQKMSSGGVDLHKMGQASLSHIQNFSPKYFADGLIAAAEYAMSAR